jgi:hypothetical protein
MAGIINSLLDRFRLQRSLRFWGKAVETAEKVDLSALRLLRARARHVRRLVDKVLFIADSRLTLPVIGGNAIQKPLHTDWAYRPEIWRGPITPSGQSAVASKTRLGEELTLFHDCKVSELTLRQLRNSRDDDLAPFGLRMDVFRFDGSFLSLVVDLPEAAAKGLTKRHILRLNVHMETEKPLELFGRLSVKHGPNTEQIVREFVQSDKAAWVEFDLAFSKLNEKQVERLWLDLIFEGPEMNQIMLRDVTITRRPRAEL